MYNKDFQNFLPVNVLSFIRQKYPYNHSSLKDKDHNYANNSTRRFIMLNNIEHFETPPQSPELMPIGMVKKCIIFNGGQRGT